jgi:hypothetical protein
MQSHNNYNSINNSNTTTMTKASIHVPIVKKKKMHKPSTDVPVFLQVSELQLSSDRCV